MYYYVNTQAQFSGEHEVHKNNCAYGADRSHRRDLGWHETDSSALTAAGRIYTFVDGCAHCCPSIHRR